MTRHAHPLDRIRLKGGNQARLQVRQEDEVWTDLTTGGAALAQTAFNVMDYGALGDGLADDTIAIQATFTAIADAGGGVAFFPPGTYLTSSQVTISGDSTVMRGSGASTIIQAKDNANIGQMFLITGDNFTAESFILDGNRDNLGTSGTYNSTIGLSCLDAVGLTFRDLEVRYVNSIGIAIESITQYTDVRAVMDRCWVHHNGMLTAKEGNDVFLFNVKHLLFTDCLFEHGYGTGGSGLYAGGGVVGSAVQLRFVNCIFRDNFNGGGQTGGNGYALQDERWAYIGCTFDLTSADPHATSGIEMTGRNLLVDGCEFYNHDAVGGSGVVFHGDFGAMGDEPGRIIVTNCHFVNNESAFVQTDTGDDGVLIFTNNRVQDGTYGVAVRPSGGSPATNVIIANNDFTENVTTPVTTTGASNVVIVGNLPSTVGNQVQGDLVATGTMALLGAAAMSLVGASPVIQITENDAPANTGIWRWIAGVGSLALQTINDAFGVFNNHLVWIRSGAVASSFTINYDGLDSDTIIKGTTATKLFVTDASSNTVEIGTTVQGAIATFADGGTIIKGDTATALLVADAPADAVHIGTTVQGDIAKFATGGIVLNEGGADRDLRIEGDTDIELLCTDAGNDRVGIGTSVPTAKLDVSSDLIRLRSVKTPASAAAAGNAGDFGWDGTYFYICVSNATWHRVAHATW